MGKVIYWDLCKKYIWPQYQMPYAKTRIRPGEQMQKFSDVDIQA